VEVVVVEVEESKLWGTISRQITPFIADLASSRAQTNLAPPRITATLPVTALIAKTKGGFAIWQHNPHA
jgi:hypothetical protein